MYWLTGLLGIVSAAAPFMLGYSQDITALWTSLGVGVVLIVASIFEGLAEDREAWEYWLAGIVGVAAIAAPFVLGFAGLAAALWTLVIVGLVAILVAGVKLFPGQTQLR